MIGEVRDQAIGRKDALSAGLPLYFTGRPCKRGHVAPRRASSGACTACEAETAAMWRARNPEKAKAISDLYRKKNPELVKARCSSWVSRNRDHRREYMRRAYQENDAVRSLMQAHARLREVARRAAMPGWLTKSDRAEIAGIYSLAREMTRSTGVLYHVDHIVPLRGRNVCGLHVPWNLQVLTAVENSKKSNRLEADECAA